MRDEVEEFLKRAAQRRAQAEAQRRNQAQQAQQAGRAPPAPPPPQRLAAFPSSQLPSSEVLELSDDDVIAAEPVAENSVGERVSASVRRELRGTREIRQQAQSLGQEVALADDKMDAHLQQVFDHKLGALQKSNVAAVERSPNVSGSAAVQGSTLVAMLRNPESLRNAFILQEIFRRPDE